MDIFRILEIISLVTGVAYMALQVFQHRWMWYVEILTAAAALCVAVHNHIWAISILNVYYIVMAVIGIFSWKKIKSGESKSTDVTIVKITPAITISGILIFIAGALGIWKLLELTSDPAPLLDAVSFSLAIVGTWWLTRSHIEQWYVWFISDILSATLFFTQGLYWMGIQFICYFAFSVIGYIHWKKRGTVIDGAQLRRQN